MELVNNNDTKYYTPKSHSCSNYSKLLGYRSPHKSIGLFNGNYTNSLIQIFNRTYKSKAKFLETCNLELEKAKIIYKDLSGFPVYSEGIRMYNSGSEYFDYQEQFECFYRIMLSKKNKNKYKKPPTNYMRTDFSRFEINRIINFLKKLPTYKELYIPKLSTEKAQRNFIRFSLKVISNFYDQLNNNSIRYELPSTYLKKLSHNYSYFKKALFPYITKTVSGYKFGSDTDNHCYAYCIKTFEYNLQKVILRKRKLNLNFTFNEFGKTKLGSNSLKRYLGIDYYKEISLETKQEKPRISLFINSYYNMCQDLVSHSASKALVMYRLGVSRNEVEKLAYFRTKIYTTNHYYFIPTGESDFGKLHTFNTTMAKLEPNDFRITATPIKRELIG